MLICAAKELGATDPAVELPYHGGDGRTTLPYGRSADGIVAQVTRAESLNSALDELLELADSCKGKGDVAEALLECLGVAESLLSNVDYPTYSEHFFATARLSLYAKPSTHAPKSMNAVCIGKFDGI